MFKKLGVFVVLLICFAAILFKMNSSFGLTLVSVDAQVTTVDEGGLFCGAPLAGASFAVGHYALKSSSSSLDVGELTLVSGTPHDDVHLLPVRLEGKAVYKLAQYESCNSESIRLFSLDSNGRIEPLSFVKDGVSSFEVSSDYTAKVDYVDGVFRFCPYDNVSGAAICDSYLYKEGALQYEKSM